MIIWNRLKYVLSPQFDIYQEVAKVVRGRVADIGFGTGFGTHLFMTNSKEVHAFEVDRTAVAFAEKVFPFPRLCFQYGDIQKGIDAGPFNFVVMIDVIEHLQHDKAVLANVKKMLAKNGKLIMSTPNRLSRYRKSADHVREYAPKELETLCKNAFVDVSLCDHELEKLNSQYQNPILVVCRNEC